MIGAIKEGEPQADQNINQILEENEENLSRNGRIPGWGEVIIGYQLREFLHPRDIRLVQAYYRGWRKLAQEKQKKGRVILRALGENPDFINLEDRHGELLSDIANFVKTGSKKQLRKRQ